MLWSIESASAGFFYFTRSEAPARIRRDSPVASSSTAAISAVGSGLSISTRKRPYSSIRGVTKRKAGGIPRLSAAQEPVAQLPFVAQFRRRSAAAVAADKMDAAQRLRLFRYISGGQQEKQLLRSDIDRKRQPGAVDSFPCSGGKQYRSRGKAKRNPMDQLFPMQRFAELLRADVFLSEGGAGSAGRQRERRAAGDRCIRHSLQRDVIHDQCAGPLDSDAENQRRIARRDLDFHAAPDETVSRRNRSGMIAFEVTAVPVEHIEVGRNGFGAGIFKTAAEETALRPRHAGVEEGVNPVRLRTKSVPGRSFLPPRRWLPQCVPADRTACRAAATALRRRF